MTNFVLFKFCGIDKYLIDSLVKGYLYFAHPDRMNDPFDCRVDVKKAAKNAIQKLTGRKKEVLAKVADIDGYLDQIPQDTGTAGICSFSLELENSLLLSHYAREHKGVRLTYEFSEAFLIDPAKEITGVAPVEYGVNPLTDWFVENVPDGGGPDFNEFTFGVIKKRF